MSPERIIFLAFDPSESGGIARATRMLLEALEDHLGAESVLLVDYRADARDHANGGPLTSRLAAAVLTVWRKLKFALTAVFDAAGSRSSSNPPVIIAAHPHLAALAGMMKVVCGGRLVVIAYGYDVWGALDRTVAWGLSRADAIWAISDFTAEQVRKQPGVDPGLVDVLHLAHTKEIPDAPRAPRAGQVLTVSRLSRADAYKGVDTLIRAWELVSHQREDASLVIVGDGDDRERLEHLTVELDLESAVKFVGYVSDDELAQLYATSEVFALPTRTRLSPVPEGEGFGLVFVEAAAARLPTVAGAGGPIPEVVEHDVTGLIVEPDDITSISRAIQELLDDRELAERLGQAGYARAHSYFSYVRFQADVARLFEAVASS